MKPQESFSKINKIGLVNSAARVELECSEETFMTVRSESKVQLSNFNRKLENPDKDK